MEKYYFFRDIEHSDNLLNGKTFHSAGYVEKLYCEIDKPNISGKDVAVSFFEPFEGTITSAWRSLDEIELFEVLENEYLDLVSQYKKLEVQ